MKKDSVFSHYYEGNWENLDITLKENVEHNAESGDVVKLSRTFSYYGVINLMKSNAFTVSTLYKQVSEEYLDQIEDPRIKASYARFLALYNSFNGKFEEAAKFYTDAAFFYRQTDWCWDEAITLLESIYWHFIFTEDNSGYFSALERLKILNGLLDNYFEGDIVLLDSITGSNKSFIINYSKLADCKKDLHLSALASILLTFAVLRDKLLYSGKGSLPEIPDNYLLSLSEASSFSPVKTLPDTYPVTQLLKTLSKAVDIYKQKNPDGLKRTLEIILAKAEVFQHLWYKDQIKSFCTYFTEARTDNNSNKSVNVQENKQPQGKISIKLFGKCCLSYHNEELGIDNIKVRLGNELLLYLASRNNLQAPKEVLVEAFFPERDISRSYNQIYVNIHRFNKALKEKYPALGDMDFIFIRQGIVYINNDILEEVDTQKYRKIMSVAGQLWLNDKDGAIELMEQAAEMFSPDIAPGFYYLDWLEEHRSSLVNMQLKALGRIFHHCMEKGAAGACSEAFYDLIELDPLNEDFYIEYIRYILKDGRDAEAMNLYRRYEARLKSELNLSPSQKLMSLIGKIAR